MFQYHIIDKTRAVTKCDLTLYQTTISLANPNSKDTCNSKIEIHFGHDRKHCGKRRQCWSPAFSQFPMFSKGFIYRVVKSQACVGKS